MEKSEMLWIASVAIAKNMDYEKLKYSDYLYGNENIAHDIYEYVIECKEIGTIAFYKKYKDFKLY